MQTRVLGNTALHLPILSFGAVGAERGCSGGLLGASGIGYQQES